MVSCGAGAGDFGRVPLAIGPAAYSRSMSLDEALFTVIAEQRVDLIARFHGPKHSSILHHGGLATGHCSLLAGEGQVIVARYIVPLSSLMPNHHHTVLS